MAGAAGATGAASLLSGKHAFAQKPVKGDPGGTTKPPPTTTTPTVNPGTIANPTPFIEPLPIPAVLQPVASLSPAPIPSKHQLYSQYVPKKFYEVHVKEGMHSFHPALPPQKIFGYNGVTPGYTIKARYGEPILTRFFNELPPDYVGIGVPQISPHLHNLHGAPESDGNPVNFFDPGYFWDNHYPMFPFNNDSRNALGTLWCHDHRFDFTAQNVYKGLAFFYLCYDALDSGTEVASTTYPNSLRLPSGEFDVPLMISDRKFDSNGNLVYDTFNLDGMLGDKYTVNGKIQPFFKVARRKYRFRLLVANPSRFYRFFLSNGDPFTVIGNDGNLLPAPIQMQSIYLGVAERADIIIDFSKYPIGTEIILENRLEQEDGRGPTGDLLNPGTPLLKFIVDRDVASDPSQVPATLRPLPPLPSNTEINALRTRHWKFDRSNGAWTVNGEFFDPDVVRAQVKRGTKEVWVLENGGGGWHHPIHIHHNEFRILSRNGVKPPPFEQGRKDVVTLEPGEEVRVLMEFSAFLGKYPIHCHNTVHEDHAMMVLWEIVP